MSDLKPCPFCGCEMEVEIIGRDWWRIKPVDGHDDLCPFGYDHEFDCSQQYPLDEHVNDWNKRADGWVSVNWSDLPRGDVLICDEFGMVKRGAFIDCIDYVRVKFGDTSKAKDMWTKDFTHYMALPDIPTK